MFRLPSSPCLVFTVRLHCVVLPSAPLSGVVAGGKAKNKKQDRAASGEFVVDYPLYQSFWRLQKYTLQQDKAVKGGEAKETWEALLADVDKVREVLVV